RLLHAHLGRSEPGAHHPGQRASGGRADRRPRPPERAVTARPLLLFGALAGCAGHPWVAVESPRPGALVRDAAAEATGRYVPYDGRAWIWVEGTGARAEGGRSRAAHVPLREATGPLPARLTDGRRQTATAEVAITVESPDRPRAASLCLPSGSCMRYEV